MNGKPMEYGIQGIGNANAEKIAIHALDGFAFF